MAKLVLVSVAKQYGAIHALEDFSLDVSDGEFISLLGPSGCGKSTTLRCVAGFEQPDAGQILFGERDVTALPPEHRDVGMVFQNYALFPHLTVRQNLAFGLEMRKVPGVEMDHRIGHVLEMVQLTGRERAYPRELSGGQQQRVALARALVIEPLLLLLDEPLANLDALLRDEMRFFIRSLQKRVGITTLYVTHDQAEAMVMSDRIVVMFGGRIAQIGQPEAIYHRPRSQQVASFIGRSNFLAATVARVVDAARCVVQTPLGIISAGHDGHARDGAKATLLLRPEALTLQSPETPVAQACRVIERYFLGAVVEYILDAGEAVRLTAHTGPDVALDIGQKAYLTIDETHAWLLPAQS
ncbi:MAG: ABC transporter ATP-binding protein [Burkholderiales bacterium]